MVAERKEACKKNHEQKRGEGITHQRMVSQKHMEQKQQDKCKEQSGKTASQEANRRPELVVVPHAMTFEVEGEPPPC